MIKLVFNKITIFNYNKDRYNNKWDIWNKLDNKKEEINLINNRSKLIDEDMK